MAARTLLSVVARGLTSHSKAAVGVTSPVSSIPGVSNFFGSILESFSGAWQRNIVVDSLDTMLASSAVYSCITLIANDISKLRIKLVERKGNIWPETSSAAYSPVLRKPNRYQTRIQFLSQWVVSKLIHGNTYVLKERDERGVVVALYVLDAKLVSTLVADDGSVYYQLSNDKLSGIETSITVPASEIIHDRCACLFHPLVGVPPLFACALSSTQGSKIQAQSAQFFANMSRPSGMLTAPDTIPDETAERLKAEFESKFGSANIGRLFVAGDGLKYEPMTIPAQQAQLIEQLRWTAEDVAGAFLVPLYKISKGSDTKLKNASQQDQDYYKQTLQHLIENIELLLDEGIGLTRGGEQTLGVELDLEGLLRMDPVERAERNKALVGASIMAPNEAREAENLPPTKGGEEPLAQQQYFPLSVLVKQPPPGSAPAAPAAPALPAPADPATDPNAKAVTEAITAWRAAADMVEAAEAQRVLREQEAERRRADESAILTRALDQIETERKALATEAEVARVAKAALEAEAQADVEDLAARLIAKFAAASHDA